MTDPPSSPAATEHALLQGEAASIGLVGFSELELVEKPAMELFGSLGWQTKNLYHEKFGTKGTEGRESARDAFLSIRLRSALVTLNPGVPPEALQQAYDELTALIHEREDS